VDAALKAKRMRIQIITPSDGFFRRQKIQTAPCVVLFLRVYPSGAVGHINVFKGHTIQTRIFPLKEDSTAVD
jgi:hypothetical protein